MRSNWLSNAGDPRFFSLKRLLESEHIVKQLSTDFIEFKHCVDQDIIRQIKVVKDWESPRFRDFLINLEQHLEQGEVIYNNRNFLVRIDQNEKLGLNTRVLVKKFKLIRKYDRFRFRFLTSKAERSLEIALHLLRNGLNTPRPIAIIEDRSRFNRLENCYYLTEFLECDASLLQVIKGTDEKLKQEIIIKAAQYIRALHDLGIIHNDLHASNILIKNIQTQPELFLIDLNRARKKADLSLKARAKDLGRLTLKQQDQLVFFQSYNSMSNNRLICLTRKAVARRSRWINLKQKFRRLKFKFFNLIGIN